MTNQLTDNHIEQRVLAQLRGERRAGRPLSDREEQAADVLRRATARDPEAWAALNVLLDGIVLGDREVAP